MVIKIVVTGSEQLPPGVEFPPPVASKYGWEEYPLLTGEELLDRCWRAEIIVLLSSDIRVDGRVMRRMPRLRLLVAVGDAAALLDQIAAREQGVELLAFPGSPGSDADAAQDICNRISQAIDPGLRSIGEPGGQR